MSMTSTANAAGLSLGQAQAAAEALARVLPTGAPLTPLLSQGSEVRETGRAVVAKLLPPADPVHKVTNMQRG